MLSFLVMVAGHLQWRKKISLVLDCGCGYRHEDDYRNDCQFLSVSVSVSVPVTVSVIANIFASNRSGTSVVCILYSGFNRSVYCCAWNYLVF